MSGGALNDWAPSAAESRIDKGQREDAAGRAEAGPAAATAAVEDAGALFALYGKLPQRRDFVTHAMPQALLAPFETFLSAGMGQARQDLGEAFPEDYLVMPAWRFWIGPACFGHAALGALVPSVDGVGRHFPLAILAVAPEGRGFEHPMVDPAEQVLQAIEARLMAALGAETGAPFDGAAIAAGLEPPALLPAVVGTGGLPGAGPGEPSGGDGAVALEAFLQGARLEDHRRLAAGLSYFWTAGHGGVRPALFVRTGLPASADFAAMVAGVAPQELRPGEAELPS
ncbi:type VI secretion system-associated protein TagF [Jiella pacifica]|uniref:Type VI secretion system-associated protein TagF n=1 Tax=Jiella pacifica TaxID=2696469 RepID=A0A6N9TA91_9HYPH|nr:type VI secretion system-associated protein TagF [Jiella pacifica]NDW05828.1 type VI secretion system-associated protein TagF [Jiella pacifica]